MDTLKKTLKKSVGKLVLSLLNIGLVPFESFSRGQLEIRKKEPHPLFIIGTPRTGTTLLYQCLIQRFNFAYVPNISGFLYKSPVFAAKMGKFLLPENDTSFNSEYGKTKGLMAPHEAGGIWNRWYPTENEDGYNYSTEDTLGKPAKQLISQTVRGLEGLFKAPFINKNVKHCIRIRSLVDIFPNALFVQMKRDPLRVAVSILDARRKNNDDISEWWSVMPKEIDELRDADYLDQVAGQVYYVEKNIRDDIGVVGDWRLLQVNYTDLCQDPRKEVKRINEFAKKNGLELIHKEQIPDSFGKSKSKKNVTGEERAGLEERLERLYGENSG